MRALAVRRRLLDSSASALDSPPSKLDSSAPKLDHWLLLTPLFATLFLSKWRTPVGPSDFAMAWPLIFGAVLVGLAIGRMRFEPRRLLAYLFLLGLLGAIQVLRGDPFSLSSLLLMMSIYLTYTVAVNQSSKIDVFRVLTLFASIVAICGLAQFSLQFVLPRAAVFPIENLLPNSMLIQNYNMQIPLSYGSKILKANGIFALEPSFYSQFLAVAIIAELSMAGRLARIALYGAGMLVAYSGTGIIVLLVTLPVVMIIKRRADLLLLGLLILLLLALFAEPLNLSVFLERAGEFSSKGSSGFERFTGALYLFEQFLWNDPSRALLGFGPGSFASFAVRADLPVAEMAFTKIIFEFGLIGGFATLFFLGYCVTRSAAPGSVKLAVAVMFAMSGIYTAVSHGIALSLLVWSAGYAATAAQPAQSAQSARTAKRQKRLQAAVLGRRGARAMPPAME